MIKDYSNLCPDLEGCWRLHQERKRTFPSERGAL